MKYLFLLAPLTLAACSSIEPPNVKLETDKQAYHMTRAQVILGINECEDAGTRPVVITAKRRINGVTTDVPVEVTCNPRYKIFQQEIDMRKLIDLVLLVALGVTFGAMFALGF